MDPTTIVGTTSAILSFVLFAGKVICVACKIHASADGAIDDNSSLEEAVTELQNRLKNLGLTEESSVSTQAPAGEYGSKRDAEYSLLQTARECEELGKRILEILDKTKAKADQVDNKQSAMSVRRAWRRWRKDAADDSTRAPNKPSLVEGIRASIQTVWQMNKISILRQQWQDCVFRLEANLASVGSKENHNILFAALEENSEQIGKIRDLLHLIVKQPDVSGFNSLQSFLEKFKEADILHRMEQRNVDSITDALRFEGMDARRAQVKSTVGHTFKWLVTNDAVPNGQPDLKVSFREWLRNGAGLYHVSGKPGSGKSTLMKLIDKAEDTQKELEIWASQTQARLIIARFYTWKAANAHELQNQEEGLTRTLLYQILSAAGPELARVVFKKHPCWNPERYRLINMLSRSQSTSAMVHFEPQEILAHLESILDVQGYRFFLLIDGMDEFENAHNHHHIAKRVLKWTSDNLERVKICVSSREDNAFMLKFPAHQRLRLHIVTEKDVRELVTIRLMEHDHFKTAKETDRQDLIDKIADEARGVFLWVVLTIQELNTLLTDRQSFKMLIQAVDELPKEMEKFLREVLNRVPAIYKKESEAIFSVATSTLDHQRFFCLFHYSMLRRCIEPMVANVDKDSHHLSFDEIVTQLQEFRDRFPSLCRGLLETRQGFKYSILPDNVTDEDRNDSIQTTHRSVFDFLSSIRGNLVAADSELSIKTRVETLTIRSAIEVTKAIPWNKAISVNYQAYLKEILSQTSSTMSLHTQIGASMFASLRELDATILRKQGAITARTPFSSTDLDLRPDKDAVSVFCTALQFDYYQYIDWASKNYPPWILTQEGKAFLVETYISRLSDITSHAFSPVPIRCLTKGGWLSINEPIIANRSLIPSFAPVLRGSMWVNILIYVMVNYESELRWSTSEFKRNLKAVFSAAAKPCIRFTWWTQEKSSKSHYNDPREADIVRTELSSSDEAQSTPSRARYHRGKEFGSQFGVTVDLGDSHGPQLIQGPQWPAADDTRLHLFCLKALGKRSGSATVQEILERLETESYLYDNPYI